MNSIADAFVYAAAHLFCRDAENEELSLIQIFELRPLRGNTKNCTDFSIRAAKTQQPDNFSLRRSE